MENKRLTRKLNSFFWWFLMSLPLVLMVLLFIFGIPQFAKNYDWNSNSWASFVGDCVNDYGLFENVISVFDSFSIFDIFDNVLYELHISQYYFVGYLLNWCLTVYFVHLIFDCVVFIFDWLHDFVERG